MMKTALMAAILIASLPVVAADYREKIQYLGAVNGQVAGNSVVKVTRTLAEPVLFLAQRGDPLPEALLIPHAESRPASGDQVHIRVKQPLADGRDARLTLKVSLMVDGQKAAITASQRGEDVIIRVPDASRQVALRSDAPVELEVPANYRGPLQIPLDVEGMNAR
ncbi:DUF5462 family protein [Edwardsiella piscicida]|uniref:DUF5462 family protein n=1 Tax=Edwardsiella piscicida TaxID=1263550 RepID=UPI00370D3C43